MAWQGSQGACLVPSMYLAILLIAFCRSAYLVGGEDLTDGRALNTIYKLSLDETKWIEMPQKMTHGRYLHVAFFLKDETV